MKKRVIVSSAIELTKEQKLTIKKKVVKMFPESGEVSYAVEKDLIAGIKISCGDYVYEDSVKSKLER